MDNLSIGIDPGSSHWSFYGFSDKETVLDLSLSTKDWKEIKKTLHSIVKLQPDIIVGPTGYGLPLKTLNSISDLEKELTILYRGSSLVGVRKAWDVLEPLADRVYFCPSVKHLSTVPQFRKINRIDMGTADKVCAVAYTMSYFSDQLNIPLDEVSFIHIELGFGFNAYIAVENGKIIDGIGGTNSSLSFMSGGALDAELAYLLGRISKNTIFQGGILSIPDSITPESPCDLKGWIFDAFKEGISKDISQIHVSSPNIICATLSGKYRNCNTLLDYLKEQLKSLTFKLIPDLGPASLSSRGAALIGNGIIGGKYNSLVKHMELEKATGTILDFIYYPIKEENCLLSQLKRQINDK